MARKRRTTRPTSRKSDGRPRAIWSGAIVEPQVEREEPADLLEALRASVAAHSRRKGSHGGGNGLAELSKGDLAKQRQRQASRAARR